MQHRASGRFEKKERGRWYEKGCFPDDVIIPQSGCGMMDGMRTFCEVSVNGISVCGGRGRRRSGGCCRNSCARGGAWDGIPQRE